MNARKKLNQAFFYGTLLVAAVIGATAQSWFVFFLILGIMVVMNLYSGDIRFRPRR